MSACPLHVSSHGHVKELKNKRTKACFPLSYLEVIGPPQDGLERHAAHRLQQAQEPGEELSYVSVCTCLLATY